MNAETKAKLIERVKSLQGLSDDERGDLLELLRTNKPYGLVWENHREDVEERLRDELPVLVEDTSKALTDGGDEAPNHVLIEGDNLEALTTLAYTHAGKIDVIYIDPPYNTGNKDFIYNDSFVDSEDSYRHSKWLSFMNKRLRIARKLLSDRGVIFISIDDNEQANLKLLCDEIFGLSNFVSVAARRRRKSQANLSKSISPIHEYVLIYLKNSSHELNKIAAQINLSDYKNPDNDPRGPYKTMPCTNRGGSRYSVITPTGRVIEDEWRFKIETYKQLEQDNRLVFPRGGAGKPRYKLFLSDKKDNGVVANTWWDELESNQDGAIQLKNILGDCFNNPKPVGLITFILKLGSNTCSTILDFFAGSGTTMHAVMQLNAEDGGHRQCILVTNNENGICENVTYERNKRVINGYTKPNGEAVEGLHANNLRYFKVEYVPRESTHDNKRQLFKSLVGILNIKEGMWNEVDFFGSLSLEGKQDLLRYFTGQDGGMLMIYDTRVIPFVVKELQRMPRPGKVLKVYVLADGAYPYTEDFAAVADRIELVAMPYSLTQALNRVLPNARGDDLEPSDLDETEQQELMLEAIETETAETAREDREQL